MKKTLLFSLLTAALFAGAAQADDVKTKVSGSYDHTNYSDNFGHRGVVGVEASFDAGNTTFVVSGERGVRDYGPGFRFDSNRISGTVYHDWNSRLSTKTWAKFAGDTPVFAKREYGHDFILKVRPGTNVVLGAKKTEYFGGQDANSVAIGAQQYFKRGYVGYRYTHNDMRFGDNTHSHLLTGRLNDASGEGFTQAWYGQGTSVMDYDWTPVVAKGKQRGFAVARSQPLNENWSVDVNVGHQRFDTLLGDYSGTQAGVGVTYKF